MKINYTHLPVKVHYFFFLGAMGSIVSYVPVYGKQLGISSLMMGSIISILPIVCIIVTIIFGYAADYFLVWRKTIFMALFVVTGTSFISIYFLPILPSPILPDYPFQNVSCESLLPCDKNHHASAIATCNGTKDTTCYWICEGMNFSTRLSFHAIGKEAIISTNTTCLLNVNKTSLCQKNVTTNYNCNVTCDNFEGDQCLYTSVTFWGFVILMSFGNIGGFVSLYVNDTICLDILGKDEQMKYGKQRLWGTIGYFYASLLSGYAIDWWSQGKVYKTYTPAFILIFVFMCIDLINYRKLKLPLTKSPNILKDVYVILKLTPIIIFLCAAVLSGIVDAPMMNFLFWYVEDLAMATGYMSQIKLIEGLTIFAGYFGSKIFYSISGKILNKFGYGYTLTFCFLFYGLRLALVSVVPTPWHVVVIELTLQGPSYALLHTTIVTYAYKISPPGTSATVQSIAAAMKEGLGHAIGNFFVGFLFKIVGGSMTFKIYSGLATLSALVYILIYTLYLKHATIDTRNIKWRKPEDEQRESEDEM